MSPGTRRARPLALAGALALVAFCGCDSARGNGKGTGGEVKTTAPTVGANVLHSYPHDTAAFTQGLVWHNGFLYESTGRLGASSLRKVRLETGEVVQRVPVGEQYFAEGLAFLGGRFYQLTWQNQRGFVYDSTLAQVGDFAYQGEGWGLATDGRVLMVSDGSNQLRVIPTPSNVPERVINVMDGSEYVNDLNEMEWVKGEVWANVWHTNRIARIDPATGVVKGWVDITGIMAPLADPEAVANGIAYDEASNRLFITGKLWPQLFEISVPGVAGGGPGAR
jgi:glutamine cyclotransferase